MRIKRLIVRNFCSHEETELDYESLPCIVPVVGKNGSGKSSFFLEAIRYVLYGITKNTNKSGSGYEKDIKDLAKPSFVEIVFEIGGIEYKVRRIKSFSKENCYHIIDIFIDGKKMDGYLAEKQEIINNIIKFNYSSFMDVVLLSQNQSNEFIIKETSSDLFDEILFINKIKKIKKHFSERKSSLTKELDNLKSLKHIETVTSADILKNNKEIEEVIILKDAELNKIEKDYYRLLCENQSKIDEKKRINEQNESSLNAINRVISDYKIKCNELKKKNNEKLNKIKGLGNKCPVCLKELTSDDINTVADYFEGELKDNLDLIKQNARERIKEYRKAIKKDEIDIAEELGDIKQLQAKIKSYKEEIKKLNNTINSNKEILARINANKLINDKIKNILSEIDKCKKISDFFADKNIPAILAKKIYPILENKINHYLSKFSSDMTVKFEVGKYGKNIVKIFVDGKYREYSTFSSGQQVRINMSARLSGADIVKEMLGATIDTLILDEPISALDDEGRESFVEILNLLSQQYKNIILITHIDYIKSMFDYHLEMRMKGGKSFLQPLTN